MPLFISQEKLIHMKKTQSWLANLTLAEIGIDESGKELEDIPPPVAEPKPKEKSKSKSTKVVYVLSVLTCDYDASYGSISPEQIC
jgi:hypothetical protein